MPTTNTDSCDSCPEGQQFPQSKPSNKSQLIITNPKSPKKLVNRSIKSFKIGTK